MKPGGGRAKGAAAERDVVNVLREHGFQEAHRTAPMQGDRRDRRAREYPDVEGIRGVWLEVKSYSKTPVGRFTKDLDRLKLPEDRAKDIKTLVWKDNGTPWRVTIPLETFLNLLRVGEENTEEILRAVKDEVRRRDNNTSLPAPRTGKGVDIREAQENDDQASLDADLSGPL